MASARFSPLAAAAPAAPATPAAAPIMARVRGKTNPAATTYGVPAAVEDLAQGDIEMPLAETSDDDDHGAALGDSGEEEADESEVVVSKRLLDALESEVDSETASVMASRLGCSAAERGGRVPCPLCPFRCFANVSAVVRHLQKAHTRQKHFVCSGRKQRKIVVALHDSGALSGRPPLDLLTRSAAMLRSSVVPALPDNITAVDRRIRLVLTGAGPVYMNVAALGKSVMVRRVGNLHYTRCFANLFWRELCMAKGRLAEALTRVQLHVSTLGCELGNLLPQHSKIMWKVAQDMFALAPVRDLTAGFFRELLEHEEFETLSMDGTVKICLGIMGQAGAAVVRKDADAAAMPEASHLRKLVTVRGRSGAVLALRLVREESADEIAAQVLNCFSEEQRQQVKFVGVDNPSRAMHVAFKAVFPSLVCLFLDAVHLAMNYEKGHGGRRSPGSVALRRVLAKFSAVDPALPATTWGDAPFCGDGVVEHPGNVASLAKQIGQARGGITRAQASAFLGGLDASRPFASTEEYVRALACVSVVHKAEMGRKGPKGYTVGDVLRNAAEPSKCQWYFNNLWHRHSIAAARVPLLSAGTTANEALHNELKQTFRQTIRLHQSTMATKMQIFLFAKLFCFTLARFRPTSRQMRPGHVLARALAADVFSESSWPALCEVKTAKRALRKAVGALQRWRGLDVRRVQQWLRKRPAAATRSTSRIKRTAFTLRRRSSA